MTARPYLNDGTNLDLGAVESEGIEGSRTLINLADTAGNTKDIQLAALLSGERIISLQAVKIFTSVSAKDTFTQRLDALWQGTKVAAIKYYPFTSYNCYAAQAYYDVFVTRFTVSSTEVEQHLQGICSLTQYTTSGTCTSGGGTWDANQVTALVVHYTLEMKEGKGIDDA